MKNIKPRGLSIIDCLLLVSLVGLISSVAIPSIIRFRQQSRQAEAVAVSEKIASAELKFFMKPRISKENENALTPCYLHVVGGANSVSKWPNPGSWTNIPLSTPEKNMTEILDITISELVQFFYFTTPSQKNLSGFCRSPDDSMLSAGSGQVAEIFAVTDYDGDSYFDAALKSSRMELHAGCAPKGTGHGYSRSLMVNGKNMPEAGPFKSVSISAVGTWDCPFWADPFH